MTAMLLIGVAIAVLLYIVVQRLDRIIALQLQHQDLTIQHLGRMASLLEDLPYREELERKRSEKAEREAEKADRDLDKAVADLETQLANLSQEPRPPQS